MRARAQASNRLANANRASHVPRERGKGKSKENNWQVLRDNPKEPKVQKVRTRAKQSKTGLSGLENPEIRGKFGTSGIGTCLYHWTLPGPTVGVVTNGTIAGVLMDGMMTGVQLYGTTGGEQTYDTSASSFSAWRFGSWCHE